MPESPEVAKFAKQALEQFKDKLVVNVTGWDVQNNNEIQERLQTLCPANVAHIWSFGKRILVHFQDKTEVLELHLGLEGRILGIESLNSGANYTPYNARLYLFASDGSQLVLDNHKGLGGTKLITTQEVEALTINCVDPLHEPGPARILEALRANTKRRIKVAAFLLEQKSIVGIGNYLRAEILYDALINPHTPMKNLVETELKRLAQSIFDVPRKFLTEKNPTFCVFRRVFDPHGNQVQCDEIPAKRTIFWVPTVVKQEVPERIEHPQEVPDKKSDK